MQWCLGFLTITPSGTLVEYAVPGGSTPWGITAGPNSGDANNDGVADGRQQHVATFVNAVTSHYTSIALDNGCAVSTVQSQHSGSFAADVNYTYPAGLLSFRAARSSTVVTVYFYNPPAGNLVLRKFINGHYQTITDASMQRMTIGGGLVIAATYQLIDGGALDADGSVNGVILDPVGLALAVEADDTELAPTGDNRRLIAWGSVCAVLLSVGMYAANRRAAKTQRQR